MLKLRKYFARYWFLFLLALVCIFGQAQSELALPDYMSDIVSNGIQAGGFDNAVAEALSPTTYKHLMTLSTKAHQKVIKDSYTYTKAKDVSKDLKKKFPKAKDLYVLKKDANEDKLNKAMIKGMLIAESLSSDNKKSESFKKMQKKMNTAVEKATSSYNKGLQKFNDGKKKYEDGVKKIKKAEDGYKKGLAGYNKGMAGYKKGLAGYNKGVASLKMGEEKYNQGVTKMKAGEAKYQQGVAKYNAGYQKYQQGVAGYNNGVKQYNQLKAAYTKLAQAQTSYQALQKQMATADEATKVQLNGQAEALKKTLDNPQSKKVLAQGASLKTMKSKLEASKKQLDKVKVQMATGKAQLDKVGKQMQTGKAQLAKAKAQIDQGKAKLASAKAKLDAGKKQLDAAKVKLDKAKTALPKGKAQLAKAKKQIDKAQKKIDDGGKKINEMQTAANNGDMFYFIDQMDAKTKNKIFKSIDKQMKTMGESTMNIAGGQAVKSEYKRLGADTDQIQNDYIFKAGMKMVAIALLGAIVTIVAALFASKIGAGVARDLRLALFKKVESFSNEEMDRFSTASLITRSTNDITQIQQVTVMFIRMVCYAPILGFGAVTHAIESSVSMTWVIGVVILIILGILAVTFSIAMPKFKIIQQLIDKLNLSMRENLSGVLVIRAFGNEKESEKRFDQSNTNLTKVNLFVNRVMASLMPIMMFIMNALTLVIIYVGSKQIDLGKIQIGEMMAFLQYGIMIIMAFLFIAMIGIMLPRASVSANRIAEVLNTTPAIVEKATPVPFDDNEKGRIVFDDVTFTYPGASEPALEHISFVAKPGQTTAFIGSTGSGKSTLINLIPRFYDVTSGQVSVDGVNVKDSSLHELRERIGVVPQKGVLFSGTVTSNITYGAPNATEEDIAEAVRISQSEEFISHLEKGMNTEIAQGGTNVSGGQRQRLAIARALAKKPEILIFDDSFSALDFKTDAKLRHELTKMSEKTKNTVLIVGQRIASIMDADQIIVLDEGRIVGRGTHKELLQSCEVYKEIAYSQLSKEELENER